jgi:primosomal protein N' (replication factor Y)
VTGYVLEIAKSGSSDLKEIAEVLDAEPLFGKSLVPFLQWMASYYLLPIGQLIQKALPGGLNSVMFKSAIITPQGLRALKLLTPDSEEKKSLAWIQDHPGRRVSRELKGLEKLQKKGWVTIQMRPGQGRVRPFKRKFVRPLDRSNLERLLSGHGWEAKAKNERAFLETLLKEGKVAQHLLTGKFSNSSYLVAKWTKKGVLERFSETVYRNPVGDIIFPCPLPTELYAQQVRAVKSIGAALNAGAFSAHLLYGVTGSGKTEVYYRIIEQVIHQGLQAILMVPEIALANYMEGFFRSRLGDQVAVYHSGLSKGERYDQWLRMSRGEVGLVIGARSALFAPMPKLGLIIVDEEHDSAYKQESNPRYQARDAAVVRAKKENAVVILGSGTPSVQSFENCRAGRYELLSMPHRIEKRPLPVVEIIDMKAQAEDQKEERMLCPQLISAVNANLEAGNQAILFLNRRGFHRFYLCKACGESLRCPNCDVPLTFHYAEDRLVCHYCGFSSEPRIPCPNCSHVALKAFGFGTEKLEHELKKVFPGKRIARMDTDSTRKKGKALQILKRFGAGEIDILTGTQMITKGYDFPNVTLVGVIAADFSLAFPDFRAAERTFQILSQVAGRAGRGSQRGRVLIQTFNPEHYAIQAATGHDYDGFFEKERALRKQLCYPPFSYLACLRLQGNNRSKTAEAAKDLGESMRGILRGWPNRGGEIDVLGPAEAPIFKLKGKYRWQILTKGKNAALLTHLLGEVKRLSKSHLQHRGVHLIIDMDPYQMS